MKRGFAWLLTLLALLGLLSGCGGGGDTTASDTASNSAATEGADDPGGSYGAWAEAEVAEDSGGTAEDGASDRLENAKMIYTARMEVETTAFDTADADLRTLVEVLGGYFEQAAVHDYGSGYRSGDYKVRIPADQFQPFLDRVGTLCHVTYQEQTSENVSEAYYDAESRLATQTEDQAGAAAEPAGPGGEYGGHYHHRIRHLRHGAGDRAAHRHPAAV